jgi:hypothetical protein
MSEVAGSKQVPRRRVTRLAPVAALWIVALVTLAVAGMVLGAASCTVEPEYPSLDGGPNNTSTGAGVCVGPTCPAECAKNPVPGCTCTTEGEHLLCGTVDSTYPDGTHVCGKGVSVCAGGTWGVCTIDNAVTLVPNPPPGFYTEGLGTGSTCINNPCDPSCIDFVDNGNGLSDAGIVGNDAGITLLGDGGSICVPKSCATLGFNCGPASDGCGTTLSCGTCTFPATCGGSGVPSVCGVSPTCTNLCLDQVQCSGTATTSISGTVYMPNGTTPLPNALVYVPNSALSPFTAGVACVTSTNCAQASGTPLVGTTSAINGTFTLTNVPVGVSFPVVIQLGRFRRVFTMPAVTKCVNTKVACATPATCLTRFPQIEAETSPFDNIPKMAFVTGCVDALECGWLKIGLAQSTFTAGNTAGRVNFYAGSGCPGTYIGSVPGTTPWDTTLLGNPTVLDTYDMLFFPCQGKEYYYGSGTQIPYETNVANFANAGGRVFSSHYSYIWIFTNGNNYSSPLSSAINWDVNQGDPTPDPQTGYISQAFQGGVTLSQWLVDIGASTTLGQMPVNTLRHDFNSVNSPTQLWVTLANGTPMQANYNTPVGAAAASQCGRVLFSDFHVYNATNSQVAFPNECPGGALTAQEFMLAQALFDLAGCVTQATTPACVPITCGYLGLNCGTAGDGCGNTLNCGTCTAPATCGGGGASGVCGTPLTYTPAVFSRVYNAASICPAGTGPVWRDFSWLAATPSNSQISFTIQTAPTLAGLATATVVPLLFSATPAPPVLSLVNQHAIASTATPTAMTTVNTDAAAVSPDASLVAANQIRDNYYLQVNATLTPSSNLLSAPTLSAWDMQIDCSPNQ